MSDDFIPFNRSTPVQNQWKHGKRQTPRNNSREMRPWEGRWGKTAHNRESANSTDQKYSTYSTNKGYNINDYLHPTMLDDLWAPIKRQRAQEQSNHD